MKEAYWIEQIKCLHPYSLNKESRICTDTKITCITFLIQYNRHTCNVKITKIIEEEYAELPKKSEKTLKYYTVHWKLKLVQNLYLFQTTLIHFNKAVAQSMIINITHYFVDQLIWIAYSKNKSKLLFFCSWTSTFF